LKKTFILTAAHVVSKPDDSREWLRDNDNKVMGRKIRVRQQSSTEEMIPWDDNAAVISEDDEADVAILGIPEQSIRSLPVSTSTHLKQSFSLVVAGFPAGGKFFPRVLHIKSLDFQNLSIVLDGTAEGGQSGGAVIDSGGYVVAIVSHNDNKQSPQFHTAAMISLPIEMLNDFLRQRGRPPVRLRDVALNAPKFSIVNRSGTVNIRVGGNSGELANVETASQTVGGGDAKLILFGGERSDCADSSKRTMSQGVAVGSIDTFESTGLKSRVTLVANGGQYRTAVTCLAGSPVGLTGHDTFASSSAEVTGEIEFTASSVPFDMRVVWQGMSKESEIRLMQPDNQVHLQRYVFGEGEVVTTIDTVGHWRLRLESSIAVRAEGGSDRKQLQWQPLLFMVSR
jgi:hypothetical protein